VDWNDILLTIEKTQPKQIWTLHGDGNNLRKHLGDAIFVKLLN
jgi:putative mRNA 3-end processing factor